MSKVCNNLIPYLSDDLDEIEKQAFSEHLIHCPECTRELDQMTEAWSSLKWDFEEIAPPETLKNEVMNFVVEKDDDIKRSGLFRRQFTPLAASALLVAGVLMFILLYSNIQLKNKLMAIQLPAEILSTFTLESADAITNTDGTAFVLQQGKERSVVVQIRNLPELQGSEVYQVWLLNNGERANAGTFKPDETGAGVLTYKLAQNDHFDQIGITKEPDANGSQPRGKKIIGST